MSECVKASVGRAVVDLTPDVNFEGDLGAGRAALDPSAGCGEHTADAVSDNTTPAYNVSRNIDVSPWASQTVESLKSSDATSTGRIWPEFRNEVARRIQVTIP